MQISTEFLQLLRKTGLIIEFLSALFSVIYFYKVKKAPVLKYFTILLWYVFLNDLLGLYIREKISDYNAIIYNIYYGINFVYLFILYRQNIKGRKSKSIVILFLSIYVFVYIINGFFENYLIQFQSIPYIIAAFFLIITIIIYFIETLNSDRILHIKKRLLFWISVGLLLYYMGNLPFRIVRNYYTELSSSTAMILVNFSLTIVMNVCFIIGFIVSNKKLE